MRENGILSYEAKRKVFFLLLSDEDWRIDESVSLKDLIQKVLKLSRQSLRFSPNYNHEENIKSSLKNFLSSAKTSQFYCQT